MPNLGVNVDHVANIRQARKASQPDPVAAAVLAELAGATCITVHLRSDRRHIQERDLEILRQVVKTKLNLEMAPTEEMVNIASRIKPDMVTLVPEKPEEVTTEGGLDVLGQRAALRNVVERLSAQGIQVGIFVDPDPAQAKAALETGATCIEIHTGIYAQARDSERQALELKKITEVAEQAHNWGLKVNAGHDLTYTNVQAIAAIPYLDELNIGHNIIAKAVLMGLPQAVKEMITAVRGEG